MHSFRPIAPSAILPRILPGPDNDKRKWSESLEDQHNARLLTKQKTEMRRNSNSSQESPSLVTEQRLRRKEQNRAAQRAFRERKERHVKELEDKIKVLEQEHALKVEQLERENNQLRQSLKEAERRLQEKTDHQQPSTPMSNNPESPLVRPTIISCARDKDGVTFCEKLKNEVCSNAYDQLLTEPLFDEYGTLNEKTTDHPVPIVTSSTGTTSNLFLELEQYLNEKFSSQDNSHTNTSKHDLLSCAEVWQQFASHPMFEDFDKDELCDRLRQIAKCSKSGPVFEDHEVEAVKEFMIMKLNKKKEKP